MYALKLEPELQVFIKDLAGRIIEGVEARSVILFGSLARGDHHETSDIDIMVVSDRFPKRYIERLDLLRPFFKEAKAAYRGLCEKGYHLTFNPVAYRSEELRETPPLLLDVTQDGLILHDDGIMKNKLKDLRRRLRDLGSQRIWTKRGGWYWVLKPNIRPGEIVEL